MPIITQESLVVNTFARTTPVVIYVRPSRIMQAAVILDNGSPSNAKRVPYGCAELAADLATVAFFVLLLAKERPYGNPHQRGHSLAKPLTHVDQIVQEKG